MEFSKNQIIAVLIGAISLAFLIFNQGEKLPGDVPDMSDVFFRGPLTIIEDDKESEKIASMFRDLSLIVRADKESGNNFIKNDIQLQKTRIAMRIIVMNNRSIAEKYDKFPQKVGDFLVKRLGDKPAELTNQRRDEWSKAFSELAAACERAIF